MLFLFYFCGLVASNNETTTIATIATKSASTTLKMEKEVTESTNPSSSVKPLEITTLPTLPDEGKPKSRRKPGFRSEDQELSETEGENVKDVSVGDNKAKGMDIKKDGKSKLYKKKGSLKDQLHGKKEIRKEDENIENIDNSKDLDSKKNVTSQDKTIQKEQKTTKKPWPSFDKKVKNKTVSIENESPIETTSAPKNTTEAPFKIGSSVVKIVPLKEDPKPVSPTTTSKSTLQNVEIPKPVSVGLDTSPSAISPTDSKIPTVGESEPVKEDHGSTGLIVGIFFGMVLTAVLVFVGLKRLDAIRRRREYRRMNDFLIDGMYNDA